MPINTVSYYRPACSKCSWVSNTDYFSKSRAEERLKNHEKQHERKYRTKISSVNFPRYLYYTQSIGSYAGITKYHLRNDCGALNTTASPYGQEEHFVPPAVEDQCRRCWPLDAKITIKGRPI